MTYEKEVATVLFQKLKDGKLTVLGKKEIEAHITKTKPYYTSREVEIFTNRVIREVVMMA
jgi:hypothetical protein